MRGPLLCSRVPSMTLSGRVVPGFPQISTTLSNPSPPATPSNRSTSPIFPAAILFQCDYLKVILDFQSILCYLLTREFLRNFGQTPPGQSFLAPHSTVTAPFSFLTLTKCFFCNSFVLISMHFHGGGTPPPRKP